MNLDPAALPDFSDATLAVQPLARADTIPSSWYTDPRFHELDRDAVFARTWQPVGHVGKVRRPGEHIVASVADNPVLVVRGKDGVLRAFYNVCRHRGGPLATADGCASALKCRYHGWTYQLDGRLRGVPAFDRTELFDRKDFGLVPVRHAVWQDLIFVNLDDAAPSLETTVAGIAERIAPIDLAALAFYRRVDYAVRCNWKAYVDNYLEAYHVPHVHPELFGLYDFQRYVTEVHGHYSVQHSPINAGATGYGAGGGSGTAWYFHVFPNFMLNIMPGRLQTNLVVPAGHDRCLVRFEYFYADVTAPEAVRRIEEDIAFSDRVQVEDLEICEHVQRGLGSRAYDRGRFSVEYEEAVYAFQAMLKGAYQRWRGGGGRP